MHLYDTLLKSDLIRRNNLTGETHRLSDLLPQAVRYDIANVAIYYWQNPQTYWDIAEPAHFPGLAPPHRYTWLEYKMPTRFVMESGERYKPELAKERMGCLVVASDRRDGLIDFGRYSDETRWVIEGHMFVSPGRGRPLNHLHGSLVMRPHGFILPVADNGSLGGYADGSGPFRLAIPPDAAGSPTITSAVAQHSKPFLLTFSFLSCNNVLVIDHDPRPKKRRNPAKNRQLHPYKTLEIRPLKDVLRVSGKKRGATGRRLSSVSITRGHFRTYTESGKLFGKYTGRFWIPAHVKGRGSRPDRDREIKLL